MPLTRHKLRSQYALGSADLYKSADKDDPEAMLNGIAIAGLVGLLRQLGDLAQFAGEMFRDLHDQVLATTARGHGLSVRVRQLEADVPKIERAILSQINYSSFYHNTGVNWQPNLHIEQNLITRGDLPRFVMDSYEECRGPPRLFLLDKYDAAGTGACLKRYTDPSFYKVEAASTGIANPGIQGKAKVRKAKKKESHQEKGETPATKPTSQAKLQQLFLEERVHFYTNDPAHIVKLTKRQLYVPPFDPKTGKSYMWKFLLDYPPVTQSIHVASSDMQFSDPKTDSASDTGNKIVDKHTVSPPKETSPGKGTYMPPDRQVVSKEYLNISTNEINGVEILKNPLISSDCEVLSEKELTIDGRSKASDSIHDYDSDNEIDSYMDALPTIESEMGVDNDHSSNERMEYSKYGKDWTVFSANDEQSDLQSQFSASDDGDKPTKIGSRSASYSDTASTLAKNSPSDSDRTRKLSMSSETCIAEPVDFSPYHSTASAEIPDFGSHDTVEDINVNDKGETCDAETASTVVCDVASINTYNGKGKTPDAKIASASTTTCVIGSGETVRGFNAAPGSNDMAYDDVGKSDMSKNCVNIPRRGGHAVTSSISSYSVKSDEDCAVDKLHIRDQMVSTDVFMHLSNGEQSPEKQNDDNEAVEPLCALPSPETDIHLEKSTFVIETASNADILVIDDNVKESDIREDVISEADENSYGDSQQLCLASESLDTASQHLTIPEMDNPKTKDSVISSPSLQLATAHDSAISTAEVAEGHYSEAKMVQDVLLNSEDKGNYANTVEKPNPRGLQPQHGLKTSDGEMFQSVEAVTILSAAEVGNSKKPPRPRSPLIDAVAAHDRNTLRKVSELTQLRAGQKAEDRDSLLDEIRTKSFCLKPAVVNKPIIQAPRTNLKVAAILEKANQIRKATAGSDEDEDSDSWSDS